jgi:predicted pyridoxine 5'-phosphate oxidase superfamily flavin-nucleotide-binding protein
MPIGEVSPFAFTDDMKRVVLEQQLGFVASVGPDGTPSLSPKGTTTIWDDHHLVFADIASPGTVRNLQRQPAVEVNVVDPIGRKGYRFQGIASVHRGDETYERGLALLAERGYVLPSPGPPSDRLPVSYHEKAC